MASSHYLNQSWLVISDVQWHSSEGNFTWETQLKLLIQKVASNLSVANAFISANKKLTSFLAWPSLGCANMCPLLTQKCLWIINYTPAQRSWRGGYTGFTLSVCPSVRLSVRPSVCRRHGFRSISQVCFGISISNFICMLMVAIGRSLLIFSDVTFKMAAWRPYWIFWFPDSNFTLALNINFKLQRHNTYVYG